MERNESKLLPNARGYDTPYMHAGGGFYNPQFLLEFKAPKNKRLRKVLTDIEVDFIMRIKNNLSFYLFFITMFMFS
jgi:hypothetical protein